MDCAYCILQNHYDEAVVAFPTNLKERLEALRIPAGKRMRVGTGQHTDSLLWGNRNNLLTDLFAFAEKRANIILELKTTKEIASEHLAQTLNYLKATEIKLALILNFGPKKWNSNV